MNELLGKNNNSDDTLTSFIKNDYFYKNLSGKPKVSFAVQPQFSGNKNDGSPEKPDAIDAFMDQRPAPASQPNSVLTNRRKSFVTNANRP